MDISTAGINPHSSNSVSSIASNAAAPSGNGLQPNASPQASATVSSAPSKMVRFCLTSANSAYLR